SVVYASSIKTLDGNDRDIIPLDPDPDSQGILFVGGTGTVYGDVTLGQNLTINSNQTLIVPDDASLTIPSGVTLTNSGSIQNNGTIRNNGRINSREGGFNGTAPTGNRVQYPQPSSDDDSPPVRGTAQASPPANAPVNVTQAAAMTAANNAIAAARAAGSTAATVNLRNPGEIGLAALQAMSNAARGAGMTLRLQADSMTANNTAVDVRITLNPALATQNLNLAASTQNTSATRTANIFKQFFSNNLMTVSLGQQGIFGQTVTIVAKLAPGLNTANLMFYVYDSAANTFRRIQTPNYRIDANGYVHFDIALGGEIVISDAALARR
ncbi:MAG: hypothetical protein FWH00_04110, partial [Oscillospiraceae bacterium]|nr:hypothetical protein [Oscillospiraceae bacterium]